jgi:hypothetical protein
MRKNPLRLYFLSSGLYPEGVRGVVICRESDEKLSYALEMISGTTEVVPFPKTSLETNPRGCEPSCCR